MTTRTNHITRTTGPIGYNAEGTDQVQLTVTCTCGWTAGPFNNAELADEAQATHEAFSGRFAMCISCMGSGQSYTTGGHCPSCTGSGYVPLTRPEPSAANALLKLRQRTRRRQKLNRLHRILTGQWLNFACGTVVGVGLAIAFLSPRYQPFDPGCFEDEVYILSVQSSYCVPLDNIQDHYLKEVLSQPQIPNISAPSR